MSGITAFSIYPDSKSVDDFEMRGDTYVFNLSKFAQDWSDFAGRNPQGGLLSATSSTSLSVVVSQKTLVLAADISFLPGMYVMIASTASPANYMYGKVRSYTAGTKTLVVDVLVKNGSGTIASWTVSASARKIDALGGNGSRVETAGFSVLGTTNTRILRYNTIVDSSGSDITAADSEADGSSFTINRPGSYFLSMSFGGKASKAFGISRNSSQLSTDFNLITEADRLLYAVAANSDTRAVQVGTAVKLSAGDVLRPHIAGATLALAGQKVDRFTIQSMGF